MNLFQYNYLKKIKLANHLINVPVRNHHLKKKKLNTDKLPNLCFYDFQKIHKLGKKEFTQVLRLAEFLIFSLKFRLL